MTDHKRLFLVDGANAFYRAYHAIRGGMTAPDGTPTHALFGFARMTQQLFSKFQPHRVAYIFDESGPTFRDDMFPAYKANRSPMPEDLAIQLPWIHEFVDLLNIPQMSRAGFEADDLIGAMAKKYATDFSEIWIISSDKDLMQLVGGNVKQFDAMNDKLYDHAGVVAKWGVRPDQITDLLGLMGDSSDNIPGVPGIGKKGAAKLLGEYDSLENLLAHSSDFKAGSSRRKNLEEYAQQGLDSKKLATLALDAPLPDDLDQMMAREPKVKPQWNEFCRRVGFGRITQDIPALLGHTPSATNVMPGLVPDLAATEKPWLPSAEPQESSAQKEWQWQLLEEKDLLGVLAKLESPVAFDLETEGLDPHLHRILGVALGDADQGYYLPVEDGKLPEPLIAWLQDNTQAKCGQNLKFDLKFLLQQGISVQGISDDSLLADALAEPTQSSHKLDDMARRLLGHEMIAFAEVTQGTLDFGGVQQEEAARYAAEDAVVSRRIVDLLLPTLQEQKQDELYRKIEMPLVPILAKMEFVGIALDKDRLAVLGREIGEELAEQVAIIEDLAGTGFNLNSTQQLSEVLFNHLGLPTKGLRKTKAGTYSTRAEVLEKLKDEHLIIPALLKYRKLEKLRNTYIEPLAQLVNPKTGRLHTSFHQIGAATGRMSSSDPNLQNIPVRDDWGHRMRQAFVAAPGYRLVSADYSQVELRIFADLTGDPGLLEAFHGDEDVHSRTAQMMFGLLPGMVSPEDRRRAKAINFGLLYGMGAHRLSGEIGCTHHEAAALIERYFEQFPKVRQGIESIRQEARQNGYVRTSFGRIRPTPDILSGNGGLRARAERMAVNTPVQGTAADLIKMAMIDCDRLIREQYPDVRMLLQVHDELVFEVPEAQAESFARDVSTYMEAVAELKVPLKVDVGVATDWAGAH